MVRETRWYYAHDGKAFGPVTSATLRKLVAIWQLGPTDLVWRRGLRDWVTARRVKGLFAESSPAAAVAGGIDPSIARFSKLCDELEAREENSAG